MIVGYARVSTSDQSLDVQLGALTAAGCEKLFSEKRSGTTTDSREALADALEFVREGDSFVVTRLDRLARSMGDLYAIIEKLTKMGVAFRCLQQSGVDSDSSSGRLMLGILGAVAAFETDLRRERQREGIERAKLKGLYKGRKPTVDVDAVRALKTEGVGPSEIAKRLGISRASVYRSI